MRVMVEVLTGRLFYVQIDDEATVGDLKREIGAQEELPEDRLILVHSDDQGCVMKEDSLSLVDYGVGDESHLHLYFNPVDDGSNYHCFFFTVPDQLLW